MVTPSTVISEDLDVVAERVQPFAPREATWKKIRDLRDEFKERASNIDDVQNERRLSCPVHKDNGEVTITGNGRNGGKKLKCKKYHDPELTGRDDTIFRFNTFTSYEALRVYQDFFVEALSLLAICGGTYVGVG